MGAGLTTTRAGNTLAMLGAATPRLHGVEHQGTIDLHPIIRLEHFSEGTRTPVDAHRRHGVSPLRERLEDVADADGVRHRGSRRKLQLAAPRSVSTCMDHFDTKHAALILHTSR